MTTNEEVIRKTFLLLGHHGWNIDGKRCVCRVTEFESMDHNLAEKFAEAGLLELTEEWAVEEDDGIILRADSEDGARRLQAQAPGSTLVRRLVYEGPWEEIPDDHAN